MKNILICTIKSWNISEAKKFISEYSKKYYINLITDSSLLNINYLKSINPDYIFFPHWSYIIPKEIYEKYTCVVFHMTDLPFGRGGSPLQNLLSRGIYHTKISALKVSDGLDTGPIYLKRDFDISLGSATEIFTNVSKIVFWDMIPYILEYNPVPQEQSGEATVFVRRTPSQSELKENMSLAELYDGIRMVDGEGYPPAFIRFGNYKIEFSQATLKDGILTAVVDFSIADD